MIRARSVSKRVEEEASLICSAAFELSTNQVKEHSRTSIENLQADIWKLTYLDAYKAGNGARVQHSGAATRSSIFSAAITCSTPSPADVLATRLKSMEAATNQLRGSDTRVVRVRAAEVEHVRTQRRMLPAMEAALAQEHTPCADPCEKELTPVNVPEEGDVAPTEELEPAKGFERDSEPVADLSITEGSSLLAL
jgi:hypothetical protein